MKPSSWARASPSGTPSASSADRARNASRRRSSWLQRRPQRTLQRQRRQWRCAPAPVVCGRGQRRSKARPWLYEASTYLSSYDEWYTFSLPSLILINNDNNVLQWFMDHARPRVHRPRSALSSRIHAAYLSRVSTVPTVRTVPPSSRSSLFHLDRPAQAMGFFDSIPFMLHAHIMFAFRQQGYCVVLGLAAV